MVLLTMTPSIVEAVQKLEGGDSSRSQDETATEPTLTDPAVGKPISHGQIIDLWKRLRANGHSGQSLEGLLRGAAIYSPPPPPKPEPVRISGKASAVNAMLTSLRKL